MSELIIILVLAFLLVIAFFIIKGQRKWKKQVKIEQHEKEILIKSIDNVLVYESDNAEMASHTAEHIEILRNTRSKDNVKKELTVLRDNIYAEYNGLHKSPRND